MAHTGSISRTTTITPEMVLRFVESVSDRSRIDAARYARMFVEECGSSSRSAVEGWFRSLEGRGYRSATRRKIWFLTKLLFERNGLEWPFRRHEAPEIQEDERSAYLLAPERIADMIRATRDASLVWRSTALYLAVSSVYGARRGELASLTPDAIDLRNGLILIQTIHRGRRRYHRIPEAIMPVLARGRPTLRPRPLKAVDREFRRLERAVALPHTRGVGWHSIRRSLDQALTRAGVPEAFLFSFLRWKGRLGIMPYRYASGTVVGGDGEQHTFKVLSVQDEEVDRAIFEVHPFLPIWEEVRAKP